MCGSSHIQSVLIGVEYRNCRRTLDVYLLFAIWMGQIQSKSISVIPILFTFIYLVALNLLVNNNSTHRPTQLIINVDLWMFIYFLLFCLGSIHI